jgi:hypothetical protein
MRERRRKNSFLAHSSSYDSEKIAEIEALMSLSRQLSSGIQMNKLGINTSSKLGKLQGRILDGAISGHAKFVQECNVAKGTIQKAAKNATTDEETEEDSEPDMNLLKEFELGVEADEYDHATGILDTKMGEMRLLELRGVRDACQEILT